MDSMEPAGFIHSRNENMIIETVTNTLTVRLAKTF